MNRTPQISAALTKLRTQDLRASLTVLSLLVCAFSVVALSSELEALDANVSGIVHTLTSR